ncbi:MAG: hypothetical protein LCH52_10390 [Bacteroidetes bacterium]|nr:hypothetical protein [Bacteroidota bacterium]
MKVETIMITEMKLMTRIACFFILLASLVSAQPSREDFVKGFVQYLISDPARIVHYAEPQSLERAERLNISYNDVSTKVLAGSEIPLSVRNSILKGETEISHKIENLPQDFFRVEVAIPSVNYKKYFYFKKFQLVAPSSYLTLYWTKYETDYFDFFVREKKNFNSYSGAQIEKNAAAIMKLLEFTNEEKAELKKKRLIYIVALHEKNVAEFGADEAKGAFIPAWDEIITCTPMNITGLAEQLLRFKLRKMNLNTPKLFGEGFGAALGGMPPRSPGLLVKLGAFLQKEGILDISTLAEDTSFAAQDKSFSIPLAAAYNHFLIRELGAKEYLRLYMQKNSPNEKSMTGNSVELKVPKKDEFIKFAGEYAAERNIQVEDVQDTLPMIYDGEMVRVFDGGDYYWFHAKGSFALSEIPGINNYTSRLFKEVVPTRSYEGEKYLFFVTREDIIIYNLYSDTVVDAHYKFVDRRPVAGVSNIYRFRVKKSLLPENIKDLKVVQFF